MARNERGNAKCGSHPLLAVRRVDRPVDRQPAPHRVHALLASRNRTVQMGAAVIMNLAGMVARVTGGSGDGWLG